MILRLLVAILLVTLLTPSTAGGQQRPRPQYQCGPQPALDSTTTEGSRWLSCDHNYWSSVYRAAKMLSRYSGIDGNCLMEYSAAYQDAARLYLAARWAEANLAKSRLTCAAGKPVRIDSEAISLLCTDSRWTVANAGLLECPDVMAQNEAVNVTGWSEEAGNGVALMVRNNSPARTVIVTEWTVYDCVGVKGSVCTRHTRPVRLGPGQSTDLGRVEKDSQMGGFSYRWGWVAEFAD